MQKTISVQVNELRDMSVGALREKYEELFNEPPRSRNKQNLIKRIAYRMQEQLEGSLSERARKRAAELADEAHIRIREQPGGARRGHTRHGSSPGEARLPPATGWHGAGARVRREAPRSHPP